MRLLGLQSGLGLLGMLGCAAPMSFALPAQPSQGAEHVPRRPDAVVVEPPPAIPEPTERADARGVIALREPLGGDAVRDLISAVVDAWQRESLEQLVALLTNDAGPIDSRSRGRAALVEAWRQRLHAHEYRRLAGLDLVRIERIERYGWEDLSLPDSPARPPEMRPDELYVRVPLEVTRVAGERLFGDVMLVVLRREEGKYKIAAYGEAAQ
ncbi:MAG TPA: hypothetical protein VN894_21465 [Polyangiaceae bacterium]|nr:hypothetical protein [Polyangiaceae bacterium]